MVTTIPTIVTVPTVLTVPTAKRTTNKEQQEMAINPLTIMTVPMPTPVS
jgi:hypothetical protein